ncbi:hypothetical protein [Mucilaginibacter rubeus]|uniref:Uncharacterized protein n=1 Tax=Mucilaginibacter rubeus TaxID=2027860 RepID=A0A5C1I8S5_9SPHI|nr:hypothetical protein [Mucilaginibacter rubeus]QEM14274.1 hypothetical protein DEO27_031080 [Mucilaginibacter rubeus]
MPLYIIEELIIRLQAFNKGVGTFISCIRLGEQMIIKTNRGMITIPMVVLITQLQRPPAITNEEVAVLARQFVRSARQVNRNIVIG